MAVARTSIVSFSILVKEEGLSIAVRERRAVRARVLSVSKEHLVRRITSRVLPFTFMGLLALGGAAHSGVAAQDAAPITTIDLAPGITAQVLAAAPSVRAAGQTDYVVSFLFKPGSEIFPHSHPGTTVLGVQSGELGWTLVKGEAYVVRGAGAGGSAVEEMTEPGADVVLEPGDAIYYEDDVTHTARGEGDTDTVVLGSLLLTSGEPLLMPANMDMSATPTP